MSSKFVSTAPDRDKTKEQLLAELLELRARIATFEQSEVKGEKPEPAVKADEDVTRQLLEQKLYGVWVNVGGNIAYINEVGANILGASDSSEIIGKSVLEEIIHPDYRNIVRSRINLMTGGDRTVPMIEEKYLRVDGTAVDVDVWAMRFVYKGKPAILAAFKDITERKQAEEALKLTQFALDNFTDSAIWLTLGGRIAYVNQKACSSLGYSREELLSMHIWDVDPDYSRDKFQGLWRKTYQQGYAVTFESEHMARDRRVFPVEVTSSYTRYGDKEYLITFDRDITERKNAEKALVRDRYILTKSQEVAHLGNWAWNLETGEFTGSAENFRIWGYEPGEVKPTREWVLSRVLPEDRMAVADFMEARARDGKRGSIDFRIMWPDESVRYVNTIVDKAVRDRSGKLTRLYGISQDVTERKSAEEALRLDEARLEALVEMNEMAVSSPIDIIRSGLDKGVKLTGSSMGFFNIMTPDEKRVDVYINSGNVMDMSGMWPRSLSIEDGGLWTSVFKSRKPLVVNDYSKAHPHKKGLPHGHEPLKRLMGVPVFEGDSIVAMFMVANKDSEYTDADLRQLGLLGNGIWKTYARMLAEEALKAAKAQAELYVDLMGHDINNMHQVALGYLELARELPEGTDQAEYLDKSMEVLQRSTKLIGNVRKLQKLRDGVFELRGIDVCSILADVRSEYKAVSGKTVVLNMNGHDHCTVHANELLHDVFSNLVNNAVKHTGDGTEIAIDLDVVGDNGKRYCRVVVEDNGPGVPDGSKDRIFNRMRKGTARGMGLGLYLVRTLVDSYNGRVWVEDRVPGDHAKGARFVVMLPAVDK